MNGPGEHPFEGEEQIRLEMIEAKTFDSGVTLLRYEPRAAGKEERRSSPQGRRQRD